MISNQRGSFINYIMGAIFAFSVVFISFQISSLILIGWSKEDLIAIDNILFYLYIALHAFGGFFGGFLVSKKFRNNILLVGPITAVLTFIFETLYYFLFGKDMIPDVWALIGLFTGSIIGSLIAKVREK